MAKYELAVEIDNSRLVAFTPIAAETRGSIELIPIEPGQKRAIVRVFAVSGERREQLTSFDVEPLPHPSDRKPYLRLTARIDNDKRLRLRLDAENRLVERREIRIRRYLGGPSPLGVVAALLLLLLVGAAAVYLTTQQPRSDGREDGGEAAEGGEAEGAAAAGTAAAPEADDGGRTDGAESRPAAGGTGETDAEDTTETAAADASDDSSASPDEELAELTWTVYFQPDRADLTAETRDVLDQVAEELSRGESIRVDLVGHTALFGTEQGRVELSRERARRVAEFLRNRLERESVTFETTGVGGSRPVTEERDRQHLNRRVQIEVQDVEPVSAPD